MCAIILLSGCGYIEDVIYEKPLEQEVSRPVLPEPLPEPLPAPAGCLVPYEIMVDGRCCIEYEGEIICDLDDEVMSICAKKYGVDEDVILYYTDWCVGCRDMLKMASDHGNIYLANKDDATGEVVARCYGNVLGLGLPKFICADGRAGKDIADMKDLEQFYGLCQR